MRYPTLFVNHGGGPMHLTGKQPHLASHMRNLVTDYLPIEAPNAIVVVSAHWESCPVEITSESSPGMLFDYYGFPKENYKLEYPASGSPMLASKIARLLEESGVESRLNKKQGWDHGVFDHLLFMYPEANIPIVSISLHCSLAADSSIRLGRALGALRNEGILILGSGYTFHNVRPFPDSLNVTSRFHDWLKSCVMKSSNGMDGILNQMKNWQNAPAARQAHPREEHLLPLFVVAAAAGSKAEPRQIGCASKKLGDEHSVSGFLFD